MRTKPGPAQTLLLVHPVLDEALVLCMQDPARLCHTKMGHSPDLVLP